MSGQNDFKERVDTVLNSLSEPFECSRTWCDRGYSWFSAQSTKECYTLESHVCSYGLALYVFLRHLLEGKNDYSQIGEYIVTEQPFAEAPHLLIFFKDGSFCIYGEHLKGLIHCAKHPFFCGLTLVLLQRLSEVGEHQNAVNLWKLLPESMIENVKKVLSKKDLIENNDLKTLKLPHNEDQLDKLLVIFYSVFKNIYQTRGVKYVTYVNGDKIFFQSGDTLAFRGSDYVYFVRSVFIRLLESIGCIESGSEDDSDFEDESYSSESDDE